MRPMKFRTPEVILGSLLTIAVFVTGMLLSSSGHAPPSARQNELIGASWFTKDAGGFFAGLQFVVATVQAGLFIYQLHLIRLSLEDAKAVSLAATRQAHVAEDTLNKIERPYLFVFNVSNLKVEEWNYEGDDFSRLFVTYSVANYGKLPAVIEDMQVSLGVFTEPLPPARTDYNHPLAVSAVLVPGEPRHKLDEGLERTKFGSDEGGNPIPDLGESDLFFWVIIRYRGTFSGGHVTRACWRYDERTGQLVEFHGGPEH